MFSKGDFTVLIGRVVSLGLSMRITNVYGTPHFSFVDDTLRNKRVTIYSLDAPFLIYETFLLSWSFTDFTLNLKEDIFKFWKRDRSDGVIQIFFCIILDNFNLIKCIRLSRDRDQSLSYPSIW